MTMYRQANGGGLVSHNAQVDTTVYVGPDAKVLGRAVVCGSSRIEDFAVVKDDACVVDSTVAGHAVVRCGGKLVGGDRLDGDWELTGRFRRRRLR